MAPTSVADQAGMNLSTLGAWFDAFLEPRISALPFPSLLARRLVGAPSLGVRPDPALVTYLAPMPGGVEAMGRARSRRRVR
jgi:hypothetical protein